MYIACTKNHGISYLQVHEAYSVMENGKPKRKIRMVKNLGPLSRFDDGNPNYLERLRQSFKDGNPLIPELKDLISTESASSKVRMEFDPSIDSDCFCDLKNIGYFLLDSLYDSLGIYDVLNLYKSRSEVEYDLNGLAKLLVFGRVLDPDSKSATWHDKEIYLFDVSSSDNMIEIYRALDVLDEKSETIQRRMNLKISQSIGRNTDICFYDVTNYWFEIDDNDEDVLDRNGAVIKEGIRKKGPAKVKNGKPIVQMGLFMDSNGIPIAYKLFPGNHIDQTTLRPAMNKSLDTMAFGRVIVVADGGLNSEKNLAYLISAGNGYIVSKSPRASDKTTKKWILDKDGYNINKEGTFKSKSKTRKRVIEDENGKEIEIEEKIVSYWSKAQYLHSFHKNHDFIEYLNSAIKSPCKLTGNKFKKYLIEEEVSKETGEVLDTVTVLSLDMAKVEADRDLMGYYTIITSELEMSDSEIIDKYHGLSRIENCFRTIKTDLDGRPVFVSKAEHINAHFLICFIALTMIRMIQYKILTYCQKETKSVRKWELGLTAESIKEALGNFAVDALPGGYYRLTKPTEELNLILKAFNLYANLRLPNISELHKLKYSFDKVVNMQA